MLHAKQERCQSLPKTVRPIAGASSKFRKSIICNAQVLLSSVLLFVAFPASTFALDAAVALQSPAAVVQKNQVKLRDWESYERTTELTDGTGLHQYVSEVSSLGRAVAGEMPEPKLRLSFIPRFNCAPIISVVFPSAELGDADQEKILAALDQMRFLVDDTRIAYPALTERSDVSLMAHYDTELRRRNNFRILVEAGSTARIEIVLANGDPVTFNYSLSGSKKAITRSLNNCQTHSN